MIYEQEDFKALVLDKAKKGAYYLIYDEPYFEQIENGQMITRDVFTAANRFVKPINIIKYANFKIKGDYTIKEISILITNIRKYTRIIFVIFNPKVKECLLMFIGNRNDIKLQEEITKILEME